MYRTQAVRDLVWALTSPPLLHHRLVVDAESGTLDVARNQGLLRRLDQPDSSLNRAVRRRGSRRLGEYFETLLNTWIEELPPAKLLGANVQVHGDEGTVGEFDLVFARDRRIEHWELAVKYYLGYPGPSGPLWYGPNPVDLLHEKWKKMRKKQLRLSLHPDGRRTLGRMGVRSRVHPAAFIKGYLYEPLDPEFATHHHPHANRDGLRGWWVHRGRLAEHSPPVGGDVAWLRLEKLQWMSDAVPGEADRLDDLTTIVDRVSPDKPQHLAGLVRSDDGWEELSRGFVVPDGWPFA